MSEQPIIYRALNESERQALADGLELASKLAGVSRRLTMTEVQQLYDRAVTEGAQDPDALIAIGLAFGQQIVEQSGFGWVRISDQWGDETCVGPVGKQQHCAPISMVQKRLARSEAIDLQALATQIIEVMRKRLAEGGVGDWA